MIGRLLSETALFDPIKALIDGGLPVFGTCAGMILLAEKIENDRAIYFDCIASQSKETPMVGSLAVSIRKELFLISEGSR